MKTAPKKFQDRGWVKSTPKKELDYSKAIEAKGKTKEQLLKEGYVESVKDGKTYYAKQSAEKKPGDYKPRPSKPRMTSAPGKKPPTRTIPKERETQDIVYLNQEPTTIPKEVGVNLDVSARQEEKRNDYGNMYSVSYPDLKSGAGMSKATTEYFNNDPSKGAIGSHISGWDKSGNPIFSGKTQSDFKAKDIGGVGLMSEDVNKNSVDYQLSNSKNPVETTGNKAQEGAIQGLNAPSIDKSSQGINTGLIDIEKLPSTKLRDTEKITSPTFKRGGVVMKKAPCKMKKGGTC